MSKNIEPVNDKGQRHGLWVMYWGNGNLFFKGFFHNNKRVGYEEKNYLIGKLIKKKYNL